MKYEIAPSEVLEEILYKQTLISEKLNELTSKTRSFSWLDIKEACSLLRVSNRTLQSYRDENLLGFSQIGSKIYFKLEDLEKFLDSHYVAPVK